MAQWNRVNLCHIGRVGQFGRTGRRSGFGSLKAGEVKKRNIPIGVGRNETCSGTALFSSDRHIA